LAIQPHRCGCGWHNAGSAPWRGWDNQAFTPSAEEIDWALAVLAAYHGSGGTIRLATGTMVGTPFAARAQQLLALAQYLANT
jgi:citrate lyase beta subunit